MNKYTLISLAIYGLFGGLLGMVLDISERPFMFLAIILAANAAGLFARLDGYLDGQKSKEGK